MRKITIKTISPKKNNEVHVYEIEESKQHPVDGNFSISYIILLGGIRTSDLVNYASSTTKD